MSSKIELPTIHTIPPAHNSPHDSSCSEKGERGGRFFSVGNDRTHHIKRRGGANHERSNFNLRLEGESPVLQIEPMNQQEQVASDNSQKLTALLKCKSSPE
ncbi:hypothetical protein CISG_07534 [Coccidioides immitis RMSCC 3703]|uniref:Uncharacterized protein n=1 Tax=Coccidioides immitis RMSCC 3703 TaxID=454286 RepID=A0A0J8R347_COCIT|nr:hypothetical protein CISG_07534 [Coccidioides immitis RMSCC 3703]